MTWDEGAPSWRWRAQRILRAHDVAAYLPPTPAPFLSMPDGTLMALTAWPAGFQYADWEAVQADLVSLAVELAS